MLRPMEIPVATTGIDKATQAMAELARQTRETGAAARSIRMPAGAGAPGGAMSIRRQGAIQAAATSAQAMQVRARAALTTAQVRADTQLARAQAQQAVAQRSLVRAQAPPRAPATPEQKLMQAVLSSRFSAQGIQPLVGRTLAAAGIEGAAAARVAIALGAIGAAGVAVEKFGRFVLEAGERAHQFGIAATVSGGTGAQIGSLRGMGVPIGDIAGASGGLRGRITSDPIAAMTAMSLGTGPVLPRPFGGTNEAAILQTALQGLRDITAALPATATATQRATAAETQLRKARILQLEGYLDQLNVSNDVWNRGKELARLNREIYSPKMLQDARDLAGETRNLEMAWDNFRGKLAKPFIRPATAGLAVASDVLSKGPVGIGFDVGKKIGQGGLPGIIATLLNPAAAGAGAYGAGMSAGSKPTDPHLTAQEANTKAMEALAQILAGLRQDLGGGPRTRGTLGGRLTGEAERRAMEANAVRVGPWAR